MTLGELQDRCVAARAITREEGHSLALLAYLDAMHERLERLERAYFDVHEAPTPRRSISGAAWHAVTQELQEGRTAAGLEQAPPRRITKPGL